MVLLARTEPRFSANWIAGFCWVIAAMQTTVAWSDDTQPLRLVQEPVLSPDGDTVAFAYGGDLWQVPRTGGRCQPLTSHSATDSSPKYSRDGKTIAFISDRDGQNAIYQMPTEGGFPRRVTYHSEGYQLQDWFPNNRDVLAIGSRDHFWRRSGRLMRVGIKKREKEQVLANAYASDASVSGDGKRVLFVREGERWWRKGYYGSRSAQIWLLDLETNEFRLVLSETYDCRWPRWIGKQNAFVFTRGMSHGYELCRFDFIDPQDSKESKTGQEEDASGTPALSPMRGKITQLTSFGAESVVYPSVSGDGKHVVFRHLFDLYTMKVVDRDPGIPTKIEVLPPIDSTPNPEIRRSVDRASDVAFTQDGLEMALVAGGDLWVMDTKLREPRQVSHGAGWDESPVFSEDGKTLFAILDVDGKTDVYQIKRSDEDLYWWQNESFVTKNLTNDSAVESDLRMAPTGERLYFVRGLGDLVHTDLEGKNRVKLTKAFSPPDYDISPDGKWVAYQQSNDDFNNEIFIIDSEGKQKPYNLSRHPDDDASPRFSPDGKLLAFTGRRVDDESDIYYVWLQANERDKSRRQRTLEEAIELIQKKRKEDSKTKEPPKKSDSEPPSDQKSSKGAGKDAGDGDNDSKDADEKPKDKKEKDKIDDVVIDFDRLHERLQRIRIESTSERSLIWDPDGKKLAFAASIDGTNAIYTVEFPNELSPKKYSSTVGRPIAWTKESGGLLMLSSGVPALVTSSKTERYPFTARQSVNRGKRLQAAFDTAWKVMRDRWYDAKTGGRNWASVRRKYRPIAETLPDEESLGELILLMLGELNGSHCGFYPRSTSSSNSEQAWNESTAHLGVRFESDFQGPGLKIRDVIPGGPADQSDSRLKKGDIILSIDGVDVDIEMDLTTVLNGRLDRDIRLVVAPDAVAEDDALADQDDTVANVDVDSNTNPKDDDAEDDDAKDDDAEDDDAEDDDAEDDDANDDDSNGERLVDEDEKTVIIRPISYGAARSLLYDAWIEFNRNEVDRLSGGKLGYLHIRAMNMSSFYEFERQLYAAGYGRDGLVIDVRENGGGSTTDLLLTSLTQPVHATTVPRGGGPGYPQSRKVYATWSKPIIVLCNQNSFSNAEIFSHAIKSLGRGRLVGVPTAGGVISTGAVSIMDVGTMRMPFRAWFVANNGVDMEMAGAQPDTVLWPLPGEIPSGNDRQLAMAVEQLLQDVVKAKKQKPPKRVYATERPSPEPAAAPLE